MKNIPLLIVSTFILSILFITTSSCTSTTHKGHPEPQMKTGEHEHHHNHNTHGHENGMHMKQMEDIKSWLKSELGSVYDQPVLAATEQQLSDGKKIYIGSCAPCHGANGKGDGPVSSTLAHKPADFASAGHANTYSDQGRIFIIKKGIQGTPMKGWESTLTEKEILAVYFYIRSLREITLEDVHNH